MEMSLHVSIEVVLGRLDQLAVVHNVVPLIKLLVEISFRPPNYYAPIRARNEIIVLSWRYPEDIAVGEQRRMSLWGCDATANTTHWHNSSLELRKKSRSIRIAGV
jgi:hypothetical protein